MPRGVSSLIAALSVLVATLAGSVAGHRRALPIRLALPPAFAIVSARYLLPQTSLNVSAALGALERERFPALASAHASVSDWLRSTWSSVSSGLGAWQRTGADVIEGAADRIEQTTGLKVHQALSKDTRR